MHRYDWLKWPEGERYFLVGFIFILRRKRISNFEVKHSKVIISFELHSVKFEKWNCQVSLDPKQWLMWKKCLSKCFCGWLFPRWRHWCLQSTFGDVIGVIFPRLHSSRLKILRATRSPLVKVWNKDRKLSRGLFYKQIILKRPISRFTQVSLISTLTSSIGRLGRKMN